MELNELLNFLSNSPSVRLLRAQNGGYILQFLFETFKRRQRITIPHDELLADLEDFCDRIRVEHPEAALNDAAGGYLNAWCHSETRYLQRFFQAGGEEPVYQLTAQAESALRFVREALEREGNFIGAESRMVTIVETLRELSVFAADDAERQVLALEEDRDRIQAQIDRIKQTGRAETYDDAQVRERFHFAIDLLQRVLSDFRLVEDKFKEITREVQDRQLMGSQSKGGLLEFVLNAESVLKDSDQGKSFYGFVKLILSPARQTSLRKLVDDVRQLRQIQESTEAMDTLQAMMPALTAEAEQVMQTNQRLSMSIRRFLDGRVANERRRLAVIIDEVICLARQTRNKPPEENQVEVEVDEGVKVFSPFSRLFWAPSAEVEMTKLEVAEATDDEVGDAFDMLAQMRRLDWKVMRETIQTMTRRNQAVSLAKLLEDHPPRSGAVEVLAYVQIAQDDDHVIIDDETDDIILPSGETYKGKRILRIPRVVFRPALKV